MFLRYTDIHICSKFPFLLPHLRVFATPHVGLKTQKGRKAYSSSSK